MKKNFYRKIFITFESCKLIVILRKMKYKCLLSLVLLIVILQYSCENILESSQEGVIEYEVEYLEDEDELPIIAILPSKMHLSFKEGFSTSKMSGFASTFGFGYLSKNNAKTSFYFYMMGQKYFFETNSKDFAFGYIEDKNLKTDSVTDETKKIAGYLCNKAIIKLPYKDLPKAEIYYTDEIRIDNSTDYHPYKSINGALMKFEIKMIGIRMRFTAKNVKFIKIEQETFEISEDFKKMTKEELTKFLSDKITRKK